MKIWQQLPTSKILKKCANVSRRKKCFYFCNLIQFSDCYIIFYLIIPKIARHINCFTLSAKFTSLLLFKHGMDSKRTLKTLSKQTKRLRQPPLLSCIEYNIHMYHTTYKTTTSDIHQSYGQIIIFSRFRCLVRNL